MFGYIHPYPDGNGRMGFLMNAMLASGGYPWTVIRVEDRDDYLRALDRASINAHIDPFAALVFASTSYAYREKQAASLVAKALDLRRDVMTADVSGSLRAGTTALRAGVDAVKAGSSRTVLVLASDCRIGAPRSALERNFGDGAAAFLIGASDVAAEIEQQHAITDEIIDLWRTERDQFVRTWEDRFVVEHGYQRNLIEVVRGLLQKGELTPRDITKAALYGPDARSHAAAARAIGLDPKTQIEEPLFGKLGNTGAAFALMLLAAALEKAKAGDRLLVAGYGDGADASLLRVTEAVQRVRDRRGMSWHMQRRAELSDYDTYLSFRNLQTTDSDRRAGAGVSATVHYRDRDEDISFRGHKCRRCGTLQFPYQRVCYTCFAKDDFDTVRLADGEGKVLSYTFDFFAGSPNPPLVVTMTEADGGARVYMQMTDVSPKELKLELPVEFTFRKIHEYGGTPNYFWKCTPIR
jgi:3-hydroxy-3-methylglutaryl CoA synthase